MTPHLHSTHVDGCYRCDLSLDEVADDVALLAALQSAYDGATPLELDSLRDALADRGYRIERIT